jgi:hypothetical protein
LLHSVPRFYNPTGTFDNDQYLVEIVVPTGTTMGTFVTAINRLLQSAGNYSIAQGSGGVGTIFETY